MADEVSQSTSEQVPIQPTAPVIPAEAVQEISKVITEGLQESLTAPQSDAPTLGEPIETVSEAVEVLEPAKQVEKETASVHSVAPAPSSAQASLVHSISKSSVGLHMREVVRARKQARIEKIMELAKEKRVIVNDDVEKLLKVSDATATRYLNTLVLAARLKRIGHDGGAKYEPV